MRKIVAAGLILVILSSCEKENTQNNYYHFSYRSHLWSMINTTDWQVDFIGTQYDEGRYPPFRLSNFDRDHQGVSGIQSTQVLTHLESVLDQTGAPDVVLLGIGINDIFFGRSAEEITFNIETIITTFRDYNPNVAVFVEQVAPTIYSEEVKTNLDELERMNQMIGELAKQLNKPVSKVIAVDMHTNWEDRFFIDDIHYNALGSIEVASRYYEQMVTHLPANRSYKIMSIGDSRVEGSRPKKL